MAIVNYSPYDDAANLGQGLGSAFSQMALQLPQMRMQQMQVQAMLKKLPYEVALQAAEAQTAQARTGLYKKQGELTDKRGARVDQEMKGRQDKNPWMIGNNPQEIVAADNMQQATPVSGVLQDPAKALALILHNTQFQKGVNIPANAVNMGPDGTRTPGNVMLQPQQQAYAPSGPGGGMAKIAENSNQRAGSGAFSGQVMPRNIFDVAAKIYNSGNAANPDEALASAKRMAAGASGTNAPTTMTNMPQRDIRQGGKPLDPDQAKAFLQQAGGDKEKAREMARQAGFQF